jgi:hypothetical protein
MAPQSAPGKGGMPSGAPTANPQTQAQYQQGMPQQPQGLGALQNAYSQFQNSAPPQPNPMFGEQPNPTAMAQQTSNVLDAYMDVGQQAPQAQPAPMAPPMMPPPMMPPPMMPPPMMPQAPIPPQVPMPPPMMPQAPNFSQMRQEDPRMQAMRNMQRYRRGM